MATKVPVKSILKSQTTRPTPDDATQAKADRDRHNYGIALQHAYRIQAQKDWESKILNAIQVLLAYPVNTTPTAQEANNFIKLVQPFQPSDLDALIEERRIDPKCGYVLCSKLPRSQTIGKDAEWKVGQGAQDFCSTACARKSAYVKAQLSEVPVWERDPDIAITIRLLDEDQPKAELPLRSKAQAVATPNDELAFERGEKASSFKPRQVMTDRVVEKKSTAYKPLSGISDAEISHTAIEGYEPRLKDPKIEPKLERDESSEDDEEMVQEEEDDDD